MKFRHANLDDLPSILELIHQARFGMAKMGLDQWQTGYPDEPVLRKDITTGHSYVLTDKEGGSKTIIGTIALFSDWQEDYKTIYGGYWSDPDAPYTSFHRVATLLTARRSGVGSRMLEEASCCARAAGQRFLRADTHKDNLPMQKLLLKNGFHPCGTIILTATQEKGEKRVAFEKELAH